jgi:hypothetical protein
MADAEPLDGSESESQERDVPPSPDWILLSFIDLAELLDAEVEITLLVSGRTITGRLIGSKRYLLESIDDFKAFNHVTEQGRAFLNGLSQGYANHVAALEQRLAAAEPLPLAHCIHLKNPLLVNEHTTRSLGAVWRGRIDAIDGWSFGSLPLDESSDG